MAESATHPMVGTALVDSDSVKYSEVNVASPALVCRMGLGNRYR